jgi:hypothetical protein
MAVHALGVPMFAAVVNLIRRCGAAPRETPFDGSFYLPAADQERHFGFVQVTVASPTFSDADRRLIGQVEDALHAGQPAIDPPARSSAVASVNATFVTSRGTYIVSEIRGEYPTRRQDGATHTDIPLPSG